jgi:hypothetical protein
LCVTVEGGVAVFVVEENGLVACEPSPNSSFILVRVPVRVVGDGEMGEATFHYKIGFFVGMDTAFAPGKGGTTTLRFRIPRELFRARERFAVEVVGTGAVLGPQKVLWAKRWEVVWQGSVPSLEPIAD